MTSAKRDAEAGLSASEIRMRADGRSLALSRGSNTNISGLERLLGPPPPRPVTLTQREIDVLRLVTGVFSAPAIGKKLYISDRTVEWHIDKAMEKLGARNRIQAVVLAIRDGLIMGRAG